MRVRASTEGLAADRAAGRALSARLYAAFRARRSSRARLVAGAARALFEAFEKGRRAGPPAWLEAAREALAAELSAPPPLAARLGVHPVYLAQAFQARYGVTTRAFVRAHRVFHAMQLVIDGTPLAEAASAVGFADQSHMTRAVRGERGEAPGRLRHAAGA